MPLSFPTCISRAICRAGPWGEPCDEHVLTSPFSPRPSLTVMGREDYVVPSFGMGGRTWLNLVVCRLERRGSESTLRDIRRLFPALQPRTFIHSFPPPNHDEEYRAHSTVHGRESIPSPSLGHPPVQHGKSTRSHPNACPAFSSHDLCHFSNNDFVSANLSAALFGESMKASLSTIPGALFTYWLSVQSHLGFLFPGLVQRLDFSMSDFHPTLVLGSRSRWCGGVVEALGGSWYR
jgi:hypothetical protein